MNFYEKNDGEEGDILEEQMIFQVVLPNIKKRNNQYAKFIEENKNNDLIQIDHFDEKLLKDNNTKVIILTNKNKTTIFETNKEKYYIDTIDSNEFFDNYKELFETDDLKKWKFFFREDIQNEISEQLGKEVNLKDIGYKTDDEIDFIMENKKYIETTVNKYNIQSEKYVGIIYNEKIIKIEDIANKIYEIIYPKVFVVIKENPCKNLNISFDSKNNITSIKGDLQNAADNCVEIIDDVVDNLLNINCNKIEQLEYALEIIKFQYNIATQMKYKGEYDKALKNYYNTLDSFEKVFEKSNSIEVLKYRELCYEKISNIYVLKRKEKDALEELQNAINIEKSIIKKFDNKCVKYNDMNIRVTNINKISLEDEQNNLINNYIKISKIYYNLSKKNKLLVARNNSYIAQSNIYSDEVLKIRNEEYLKNINSNTIYNLIVAINNVVEKKNKSKKEKYFEKILELYNSLLFFSNDIKTLRMIIKNLDLIYETLKVVGRKKKISNYMDKVLERVKEIVAFINTVESLELLSKTYTKIGTIYCENNELLKGVEVSKKGINLLQQIVGKYPEQVNVVENFKILAMEEEKLATKLEKSGNKDEAMQHYMVTKLLLNNLIVNSKVKGLENNLEKVNKHLHHKYGKLLLLNKAYRLAE